MVGRGAHMGKEMEASKGKVKWVLSFGCSSHMTNNATAFCALTPTSGKYIRSYGSRVEVKGVGVVVLDLGGSQITLTEVLFVPVSPILIGLISTGRVPERGAKLW